MKRTAFAILIIAAVSISAEAKYSGGSGTSGDPYRIGTAADLLSLAADTGDYFYKYFILTADIDLASYSFTTAVIAHDTNDTNDDFDGASFFASTFDGAGHKIINLTINTKGAKKGYLGLFGLAIGEIKNLDLENVSITGGDGSKYLGGLAGRTYGSISNCHSTGILTGGNSSQWLGGLVGYNASNISNCYSTGAVTGGNNSSHLGGLVGENYGGDVNNCYSKGTVASGNESEELGGLVGYNVGNISNCYSTGAVTGGDDSVSLGGLMGENSKGTISNCYSTGKVTGGDSPDNLGGLAGSNGHQGHIKNCYSIGDVNSGRDSMDVGGLVGSNGGTISNCYSTGDVNSGNSSTKFLGGLVGGNDGSISNCYSTGTVTSGNGSQYLGGLVGHNWVGGIWDGTISSCYFLVGSGPDNGYGTPLTDTQMKQQSSFVGWDFVGETANGTEDIWTINEGVDYPKLAWNSVPSFTLTVNTVGNGSVTKNPDQATYSYGDAVELTAAPDVGWSFDSWSGGLSGNTNPDTITIDGNETVTATFTKNEYTLTVNTVGNGSVTKNPDQATYSYGDAVELTAAPDVGWSFDSWSGDMSGSANPETITLDGNETVTATFIMNVPGDLSVTKCTVTAGKTEGYDTILVSGTMNATADDLSDANNIQVTVDSNIMLSPCVQTFPIDDTTFKKGKYSYSETNETKTSFKFDTKTGKFSFKAKNVDLSGLGCPLTVEIRVGGYTGAAEVNEVTVNGPKKPIPIKLMMGVKDSLRVDKIRVKKPNSDQLLVKGGFAVADTNVNLAAVDFVVGLAGQTWTIPAGRFTAKKGVFTCKNIKLSGGEIANAGLNLNTCVFTMTIKNTKITAGSGAANFSVEFADFDESVQIVLPQS
jgi:hypothetical protein